MRFAMKGHLPYYSNEVRERRGGPQGRGGLPYVKLKYKNAMLAKMAQGTQRRQSVGANCHSPLVNREIEYRKPAHNHA